jgi:hypothetical protein
MAVKFRERALQTLSTPGEERPRTRLVPARRWLIALAVIAMMVAGALYLAVGTLRAPVRGFGVVDDGGIRLVSAPAAGEVQIEVGTGDRLTPGQELGAIVAADGTRTPFTAPVEGIVMQLKGPGRGWRADSGEVVMVLAATDRANGPELDMYLPGQEATELTEGRVEIGAPVWFDTANYGSIQCVVKSVDPYPVPVEDITRFNTNPVLEQAVTELGSVLIAEADCPGGELNQMLPRTVAPVTVEVNDTSPIAAIFGAS